MRKIIALAALMGLALSTPAFAKKGDIDFDDPKSVLKGAEYYAFTADAGLSKKTGVPKRVAIGGFQIQYTFVSQEYGYGSQTRIQFAEEDYVALTQGLYDAMVEHMEEDGYEVVPMESVVGSNVYANLGGQEDAKTKSRKGIYMPEGMKRLTWITTKPAGSPNMLAGLNEELGVDATLFVNANFALCEMGGGKKTKGTKVCLGVPISGSNRAEMAGSSMKEQLRNYPALDITWLYGSKQSEGVKGNPLWFPKQSGKILRGGIGNPFILMDTNVRRQVKKGFFGGKYAADYDAFVDAAFTLWDTSLTLGFAPFEEDRAKAAKKWGG